jgi:hypothetical protein
MKKDRTQIIPLKYRVLCPASKLRLYLHTLYYGGKCVFDLF